MKETFISINKEQASKSHYKDCFFKRMCLKISILICVKSVSTLKYHLKIQKKIYEEKNQKILHLFDFSLKNKSPEVARMMPLMFQLVLHSNREHRNQLKSQLGIRISIV